MLKAQEIADTLIAAERNRTGIAQFSDDHPDIDVATAYQAQRAFVQAKIDAGETFVGYKLGLTSRNKQQAMGLDAPLYGRVTSGMIFSYGEPIRLDRFIHPRVESEIAFLLARDIDPPATVVSVLAATEVIFGAVDVLDSRYESFKFTLSDVVSDNASAGAFYLGPIARRPDDLGDLRLLGCNVLVGGDVAMTATGAAVMGHPAASVAWLANQLAVEGETLKAGQLIFSGGVDRPGPGSGRSRRYLRIRRPRINRGIRSLTIRQAHIANPTTRPRLIKRLEVAKVVARRRAGKYPILISSQAADAWLSIGSSQSAAEHALAHVDRPIQQRRPGMPSIAGR